MGLIGGSVALALKKAGLATHIVGIGRTEKSLSEALDLGVIDSAETNIEVAIQEADLILIAAPVAQTTAILQSIKPHLNKQTVIVRFRRVPTQQRTSRRRLNRGSPQLPNFIEEWKEHSLANGQYASKNRML